MQYDPSKVTTDQLLRSYRFHDNDIGCMTMAQECRRMYLLQEIGAELRKRGIDPHAKKRAA